MKNRSFPRWSALLIGPAVGAALGWRVARGGQLPLEMCIAGGMGIGFLAGLIVLLLEPGQPASASQKTPDPFDAADRFLRRQPTSEQCPAPPDIDQTLVGRFLAVLSIVLVWAPLVNLGLAIAAFIANRRTHGWARRISVAALVLALGITIVLVVALFIDPTL